jgi:hypothetical protein
MNESLSGVVWVGRASDRAWYSGINMGFGVRQP